MIGAIRDYTIQTVFVALHATVIVYGIAVTATCMKASGYPEWDKFHYLPKLVRHAGLIFFLFPAVWAWGTVAYDRSSRRFPTEFTVATGLLVLLLLWWIFSASVKRSMLIF